MIEFSRQRTVALFGNLTLLSARKNVALGNVSFSEKVKIYKQSAYIVTNTLEKYGTNFGLKDIRERQVGQARGENMAPHIHVSTGSIQTESVEGYSSMLVSDDKKGSQP